MDIRFHGGRQDGTTQSLDVSPHRPIEFQYSDPATGRPIPSLTERYEPTGEREDVGSKFVEVFEYVELLLADPLDAE